MAFILQANYTDRTTAAAGEVVPTFAVEDVSLSAERVPSAVNLSFLGSSSYSFFKISPHYSHEAEWTPFQIRYI
jgi:hypothetical protein